MPVNFMKASHADRDEATSESVTPPTSVRERVALSSGASQTRVTASGWTLHGVCSRLPPDESRRVQTSAQATHRIGRIAALQARKKDPPQLLQSVQDVIALRTLPGKRTSEHRASKEAMSTAAS